MNKIGFLLAPIQTTKQYLQARRTMKMCVRLMVASGVLRQIRVMSRIG
jgi:hypothetical protein